MQTSSDYVIRLNIGGEKNLVYGLMIRSCSHTEIIISINVLSRQTRLEVPPQVATFAAFRAVSPSASRPPYADSNRITPDDARNQIFEVAEISSRVRVRFGKFSDIIFGNRLTATADRTCRPDSA